MARSCAFKSQLTGNNRNSITITVANGEIVTLKLAPHKSPLSAGPCRRGSSALSCLSQLAKSAVALRRFATVDRVSSRNKILSFGMGEGYGS